MKLRYNPILVSIVLQSLCLAWFTQGSLRHILSTWREATFDAGGYRTENLILPLSCCFLGIEMIGLIILWTAYRKRERKAWFVMLIVLGCFFFGDMVPVIRMVYPPYFQWPLWFAFLRAGDWRGSGLMLPEAVLPVLVMLLALLLPIRAFFWRPSRLG